MSYRTNLLSPIQGGPLYGLGTMPGKTGGTSVYSTSFRSRASSGNRYPEIHSTTSSRPTSRPLPSGPGPLDTDGRRLIPDRKYSPSLRNVPVKADHGHITKTDYTPITGTLPRKFLSSLHSGSSSSTSNENYNRSVRSRSLATQERLSNTDKLSNDISNIKLNSYDSSSSNGIKTSSRAKGSDDILNPRDQEILNTRDREILNTRDRESRRDAHEVSERHSRLSNGSTSNIEDSVSSRNKDNISRATSLNRDSLIRRDSASNINHKPVSRQSSSSSLSSSSTSRYAHGGKVGLRNIGNTCFMNSVIQCLSNTRPLLEYCLNDDYTHDKNTTSSKLKGALVLAYVNLMTSCWKEKNASYVSPNNFKTQIQKFAPRFSGYQQQDSQEFLRYLLEGLHEDVNRVTQRPKPLQIDDNKHNNDTEKAVEYWNNYMRYDNSRIVEIFVGQLKSELRFDECGHRSTTFDPFWDLSLPVAKVPSESDLTDCLGLFMKAEKLEGNESPTCAKCKKRSSCTKRFSIQRFPQILVLHLKRFSQERYSRKITTLVNFPIKNLDLTEFAAEKGQQPVYNLYAVSEHSGTTYGGHYTAKCKHPYSGEWNSFNDTHVSSCGANQAISSEAYVLFYELVSSASSRL